MRPHPVPRFRRIGGRHAALALLLIAGLVLAACNDEAPVVARAADGGVAPDSTLPAATPIPDDIDDGLELPDDSDPISFDYVQLVMLTAGGELAIGALVADTIRRRTRGVMFRQELPDDTGMIFAFPVETRSPFWNQDSPMDLEIAFLDAEGVVQEILALRGNDPTLVTPETPYLFAIEMPAGWWLANGAAVGTRFVIPAGVVGLAE